MAEVFVFFAHVRVKLYLCRGIKSKVKGRRDSPPTPLWPLR